MHLEEVTGADNAFLPRSSVNDIYTAIVDDVKDAIEKLPTVKFPQNGAATKGAAKMLYAYVLMTKPDRDYATAETQLKDIMNMGYELLPNYADIYDTSKKNGKESNFEIQYQWEIRDSKVIGYTTLFPKQRMQKLLQVFRIVVRY